jgi:hypothetical protein
MLRTPCDINEWPVFKAGIARYLSPAGTFFFALQSLLSAQMCLGDDDFALDSAAEFSSFYLRVGTYLLDASTTARVDGSAGRFGTRLDFEDDLNIEKRKDTLLAAARWRVADRHFLEMEYFNLTRYGRKRIDKEINFHETVFNIGADVNSSFTTEVTRIGYGYRVIKRPNWGLALSAGIHITRLQATLDSLEFDSTNLPVVDAEIASVTAPLPTFGLSAARRLSENWTLVGKGQWFFLKFDEYGGSITHATAHFEHSTFRHAGFGFGYDWFDINVDTTDTHWRGSVDVRFQGPLVFIQASFR